MNKQSVIAAIAVVTETTCAFNQIHFTKAKTADNFRIDHGVPLYRCSSMAAFISMRRTSSDSASSQPSPDSENCSPSHGSGTVDDIDEKDHQYAQVDVIQLSCLSQRPETDITLKRWRGVVMAQSSDTPLMLCDRRTVCPFVFCHHQCRCHQFNLVHPGNGQCTDNLAGDNIMPQRGGT